MSLCNLVPRVLSFHPTRKEERGKMFLECEGDMSHRIFLCLYATSFPESFLFIPRGRKREAPGNEVGQKCNLKLRHTLFLARKSVSAQVKV